MNMKSLQELLARRLFLTRFGTGATLVGTTLVGSRAVLAQSPADVRWQPQRHAQDDWFDKVPGQHRFIFDTTSPEGLASGLQFANNFLEASKNTYGLQDTDSAV